MTSVLELKSTGAENELISLIVSRRKALNMKCSTLSKLSGISKQALCKIENRQSIPRLNTLKKICDALQMDVTLITRY